MWFLGCFISYLSETLLKVEKILTQASQGPLKVVQIHMPHPEGIQFVAKQQPRICP